MSEYVGLAEPYDDGIEIWATREQAALIASDTWSAWLSRGDADAATISYKIRQVLA